jgi:serine/threonine-protein kinase
VPESAKDERPTIDLELAEILDVYRQELRGGVDPAPEACLDKHPALAEELGECLQGLAAMEELRDALSVPETPAMFAPRSLGDFQIVREIGRGGMGVVYEAIHLGLNRRVALKMIRAGALADAQDHELFRKEALAAAALQHPNIVQLHEVGEHEGQPYLVLEYVDGGSLEAKLAGTPLDASQAAQLLATLAHAMQYAHERGIIHRDLKPANVLLKDEGVRMKDESGSSRPSDSSFILPPSSFTPKITDFGLAKQLHGDANQTHSGTIKGTPSYMAPEQASGGVTSEATDVYALGAILYETLTGRPPFRAATALDTLVQVTTLEPVPPSRLQPMTPRDLETICLKCLQKDPRRRYASALELAEELGRFLRHEPIQARRVGVPSRFAMWCRRNPVVAALLGVAAALTMLVVVLLLLRLADWSDRRAKVLSSNVFAANHLANTILVELWKMAEAVDQTANDPKLRALLKREDLEGMKHYFEETHRRDPERRIIGPDGKSAFHTWHIVNKDGILLADVPAPKKSVIHRPFMGRDYFTGANRHMGVQGRARVHVSRAYLSVNDELYKITLSAVVYDGDNGRGNSLGVVSATIPANARLGTLQLQDPDHTAVLVTRVDKRNPHVPPPKVEREPAEYLILVHPGYSDESEYGRGKKAEVLPRERLRAVTPPVPGDEFISRQQLLDAAEAVDDGYEDPVGATNPAYAGRWLAGFAPVGNTELVVIVQQKREEWSDALGMWFWLSVVCAALSAAGVAAYRYRRSWTRIPQEPVGPTPQTAPTVPLVDAPIRAP